MASLNLKKLLLASLYFVLVAGLPIPDPTIAGYGKKRAQPFESGVGGSYDSEGRSSDLEVRGGPYDSHAVAYYGQRDPHLGIDGRGGPYQSHRQPYIDNRGQHQTH